MNSFYSKWYELFQIEMPIVGMWISELMRWNIEEENWFQKNHAGMWIFWITEVRINESWLYTTLAAGQETLLRSSCCSFCCGGILMIQVTVQITLMSNYIRYFTGISRMYITVECCSVFPAVILFVCLHKTVMFSVHLTCLMHFCDHCT